ncbi:hypothetical protein J2T12_003957 [Paenibacillus anaericanus]|uniref:hypothetical protein n=1 Tax=Paenibacillus anaericanus TaxID=170367 RepID=UPI0027819770|nr:hypothetical protein [Paenibacillus anaericanus]MDQ0090534.1 hypothetical protein [Paenibacillus anaericanus]
MNYLSEEEQYKETLNDEEIKRIRDPLLKSIREKYWHLKRDAFLDEQGVPDKEFGKVFDELTRKEQEEIQILRESR